LRLKSLKVEPLGEGGWESPLLEFGRRTTMLFAANGSGKSPVVRMLASALGFPNNFRAEILEKCSAVVLYAEVNGKPLTLRRALEAKNGDFFATIDFDGEETEHYSQASFSIALFELLGLKPPRLVTNNREETQPYIATLLPLFYLVQGHGYSSAYRAPSSFIADQFAEMVRFAFGLNPKHSFEVKKSLIDEKSALEAQTRKIVAAQRVLEYQSRGVDDSDANKEALQRISENLTQQIDGLRVSVDAKGTASSTLSELLRQKDVQIRARQLELFELQNRVAGIETIRAEIDGEVKTLGLNEEARGVFTSFQEICRVPNCGLFLGSAESYGKNLLYLKDQIKDLERNSQRAEIRAEHLEERLAELNAERQTLVENLESPSTSGVDQLVTAVQALTKQLVGVQGELARISGLKDERSKLFKLEQERDRIQDRIDGLTNSGRTDHAFNDLRRKIRELTVKWMDMLDTTSVSRNIDIDVNLRFTFGGETLETIGSGGTSSTTSRLVLAIHAALLEAYLADKARPFRFLILDTPKQDELHTGDLARYLTELEKMCEANDAQLIFSSTEYDHPTAKQDKRWLPTYRGPEKPMYLGKRSDLLLDDATAKGDAQT
jgi:phosphatidylserine decarboxylase